MEKNIGIELRALVNLMRRKHKISSLAKACESLTGMHGYVLGFLFEKIDVADVFQRDIEQEFEIRRSTATEMLKLMEKNGIIRKETVENDARLKKILLTEKACEIKHHVELELADLNKLMCKDISEQELNDFSATLEKIKNNVLSAL